MAQPWIIEVPAAKLDPRKEYFLANRHEHPPGRFNYAFYSRGLNGKTMWSSKPGIAMRFDGGEKLKAFLAEHTFCTALEIPKDAATRWKARKRVPSWRRRK